ncbi:TonB-dependent receptor [Flavobacterium aquicola]|uniref:Outer membrane receptor protein involved in Fe transport n=1 Tax=Flavobacterium aquicola TaxID=1682742 RepID=A0A3E0E8L0_9FLAO|nr:carboxypeptidase-like regulatory domain-containing protein [Flavobacterium aquicola]REG94073.1 outer membrane receptor protein involved in Fe transport [Flavobacterium aquicola]
MNIFKPLVCFIFLLTGITSFAQTAFVKGVVLDKKSKPVEGVNVSCANNTAQTNDKGFFQIAVPSDETVTVEFTHVSLKKASLKLSLKSKEVYVFNMYMSDQEEQMGEVIINNNKKSVQGILTFEAKDIRFIPGANAGIENILKTLPGVNSNNELSTQYSVRGGNYDENLVYVNEIEVYRPFLIRSGQQEGLSFINTDLVQNIDFSAGGFQAKYGDKMSSVLDITYRNPTQFGASLEMSFLGGSLAVDAVSKDKKWSAITGVRYRNNSLLVNSQETQTNYTPTFADIQTNINYKASDKWQWSFLGNISQNKYLYQPLTRQTNFGTVNEPMVLAVYYQGKEKDLYNTYFGAIKTTYQVNDTFSLKFIGSVFHTIEQEYFDIYAQYRLGEVDTNIGSDSYGDIQFSRGIGSQLNHARNDLDALIANLEIKGLNNWKQNQIEWGVKYTKESIRDRISEWEVIDSAGFSIRPPIIVPKNDEPYVPYSGLLLPYQFVKAVNFTDIDRFSAYAQWSHKDNLGTAEIWYNLGMRMQSWEVSGDNLSGKVQTVFSPRAQFAIKPDWKKDMLFRFTIGLYNQPPFYRELRDYDGAVQPDVKAQKSLNIVLANDYSFKMWQRPFKLVTEAYYKNMTDVNTYTLDNVRIRYAANNNAAAFAQGLDLRLNGEFVPGTDSWISFGYLKTEENIDDKGYISRPTDQRLKFGLLFQDYMPKIPSLKLYLNLVYNTGLPGGSPSYSDPYLYQNRLNDYRRVDVGFSKVFIDQKVGMSTKKFFKNFKELSLGFEIFNLFNNQNAITNTWVRDVYTKTEYGIPNYMTERVFNLKLNARL